MAAENAQLEELLSHADAQAQGGSGQISRLEDELAKAQAALISAEAAAEQSLAAQAAGGAARGALVAASPVLLPAWRSA